jgi:DNA-directed RNA polymerase specialized sigma24 family protein
MNEREYAISTVEQTLDASAALRAHLRMSERIGRRMISALQAGVPVSKSVEAAGACAAQLRQESSDLFAAYEHSRHVMRAAFILPSVAEGMSISDIGRALGVSRQRASRLVQEARDGSVEGAG